MRLIALSLVLFFSLSAHGDGWRRVLLPVWMRGEVAGAFGSRWVADAAGFNGSPQWQVNITGDPLTHCRQCGAVGPRAVIEDFRLPATKRPGEGRFVYLFTPVAGVDHTDRVTIELHVRDISRESEGHGTEVPVVGAEDTFTAETPIALVNIPMGSLYRQKLRIYDFDGEFGRTVNVKIYRHLGVSALVAERSVTLSSAPVPEYPHYPGYAQLDLDTMPEVAGLDRVHVVIELSEQGSFWAFVSVTNNVTQQVTTVSP